MFICPWWESLCFQSHCRVDSLIDNVIHLWRNSRHYQHICAFLFFFFLLNISFWHNLFHKNRLSYLLYVLYTNMLTMYLNHFFLFFCVRITYIKTDALLFRKVCARSTIYQNSVIFFVVCRLIKGRRKITGLTVIHRLYLQGMTINAGKKITDGSRALQDNINRQT